MMNNKDIKLMYKTKTLLSFYLVAFTFLPPNFLLNEYENL